MNKKLSVLFICSAAILAMLLIPTVFGDKRIPVSGEGPYTPTPVDIQIRGNNVHLKTTEEMDWSGGISGHSTNYPCLVVIYGSTSFPPTDWDFRWYTSRVTFAEGACTIEGLTGGLVMRLVGKDSGPGSDWVGKWVILKGSGDLAGVSGRGTWTTAGRNVIWTGWVHLPS
jgi:hypothetical protein